MKPPLKWAGGKRWLLPILKDIWLPYSQHHYRLVEPFAGGMAVALGLDPSTALLNDANVHLINFYLQIKRGLAITSLLKNDADFYYDTRENFNELIRSKKYRSKKAAEMFYYLIRTGFNGLCRFNSKGEFNVPFGQHNRIVYQINFDDYQPSLAKWKIMSQDFEKLSLRENDFLYVDPPYDVEFTQYHSKDFKWKDQERLATWLGNYEGPMVASNQATKRILELYQDLKFTVLTLSAPRRIACNGDRRPTQEILAFRSIDKAIIKKLRSQILTR